MINVPMVQIATINHLIGYAFLSDGNGELTTLLYVNSEW